MTTKHDKEYFKTTEDKGNSNICRWYVNTVCFCHHKTRVIIMYLVEAVFTTLLF